MFSFFNKKKIEKHEEKVEEPKKIIIQNIEELKAHKEQDVPKQVLEKIFNNTDYKLPGKSIIDNEFIKELVKSNKTDETIIPLGLCDNDYYYETLESMPNLIVGGTVMSGKSSFIHTIIGMILLCKKPYETKLIICDSKIIEYNQYNGIPHLMCPVVSDPKQAEILLQKMVNEIEKRYHMLSSTGTKKIEEYNEYVEKWNNSHTNEKLERIPSIVIIIDDYDMISNIHIDDSILYIAKNGWRVNVYLIIVSTHPSSEIISSASKSLIPARLCFKVTSSRDSMLIIDDPLASRLSGVGSAVYISRKVSIPKQLDVQILKDDEVKKLIDFAKLKQEVQYDDEFIKLEESKKDHDYYYDPTEVEVEVDTLYDEIKDFVIKSQKASASLLQRKFRISYSKAATMIDQLEEDGIIGPATGNSKPREVLYQYIDEE